MLLPIFNLDNVVVVVVFVVIVFVVFVVFDIIVVAVVFNSHATDIFWKIFPLINNQCRSSFSGRHQGGLVQINFPFNSLKKFPNP